MDKKIFKITIWVTLRLSLMLLSMLLHLLLQNKKKIEKPLITQLNIGWPALGLLLDLVISGGSHSCATKWVVQLS